MSLFWRSDNQTVESRLLFALIITIAVWIYIELVGILIGQSTRGGPLLLETFPVVRDISVQILRGLLALAVALTAIRLFDIPSPREWMGIRRPTKREWVYLPVGFVLSFIWLLGALIVIRNVFGFERTMLTSFSEAVRLSRIVTLLILVGPAEEVIFHGVIQRSLEDVIGLWPAILLGGILFGVTHFDPAALSNGDLLFYGAQGGFGVIAGWIYARTDNLIIPALVHGTFISFTTALPLLSG